jgi:hypothetical protein
MYWYVDKRGELNVSRIFRRSRAHITADPTGLKSSRNSYSKGLEYTPLYKEKRSFTFASLFYSFIQELLEVKNIKATSQ